MYPQDSRIRANDVDRATVAGLIDRAYADGELDPVEHAERLQSAMAAKTRTDLLSLVDDLQVEKPDFGPADPRTVASAQTRKVGRTPVWLLLGLVSGAVVIVGVIALMVSGGRTATQPSVPNVTPGGGSSAPAPPTDVDPAGTSTLDHTNMVNAIRSDFFNDEGHRPDGVDCPTDLLAQVGASVGCTITDRGNTYPVTVSVLGLHGGNVTYNVSIDDLP